MESPRCSNYYEGEPSTQSDSLNQHPSSCPFVVPYSKWIPVKRFGSEHNMKDTVYVAKVVKPFYKVGEVYDKILEYILLPIISRSWLLHIILPIP